MNEHDPWKLKLSPARYLLDHRGGTRADLARRLVANDERDPSAPDNASQTLPHRVQHTPRGTGKDALQVTRSETRESVVREWIKGVRRDGGVPSPEDELSLWLMCGKEFDMTKEEEKTAESVLRNCAKKGRGYGRLGAPKVLEVYPSFWTHRGDPRRPWRRSGGTRKSQRRQGRREALRGRDLAGAQAGRSCAPQSA